MQTKFSALIPALLSGKGDQQESKNPYFWHSFFLLKPEFIVLQNSLFSNYSIDSLRGLISRCLEAIAEPENDKVHKLKKANASFLLVQIFESLWPRIRAGTFGVDAINILCGLQNSNAFFEKLFSSILAQKEPETVLVLLSILVATRDIETNALTDFFITKCEKIVNFCMHASDLHILLFSLLLQLERPLGPFAEYFKHTHSAIFNSLVANLLARSTQLYVCCRPVKKGFFTAVSKPSAARIGLYVPSDFELPSCFQLFEPFVDAAALNFLELSMHDVDPATLSAAISLFTHIEASPQTPHSGDRLYLFLIAFAFLFDNAPQTAASQFDFNQSRSCFNGGVTQCVERSIGAMIMQCTSFLISLPTLVPKLRNMIGRIMYSIVFIFTTYRGTHYVDWKTLFSSLFSAIEHGNEESTEFNTYVITLIAMCSSFRAALFKRDDGYIELLKALSVNQSPAHCSYAPTDAFQRSDELIAKCQKHVSEIAEVSVAITREMTDEQVYEFAQTLKVEVVPTNLFAAPEKLTEQPKFTQFLRVYERTHCENIQAFLRYTAAHNADIC